MTSKLGWLKLEWLGRKKTENDRDYRDRLLIVFMIAVLVMLLTH